MPGPQLCRCNPFRGRLVGRGLDPSAAARGLAALQAPANGECRGRNSSLPRGVGDAAPYRRNPQALLMPKVRIDVKPSG